MISKVNANVSNNKQTFWEAMQYVITIQHYCFVKTKQVFLLDVFDQYMYPFYKKDKESGRMNDYQAFRWLVVCSLRCQK